MKKTHNFPFEDEYEKLELLISQGQFELLSPESDSQNKIRLIYLMNDAVESFLVFHEAKLTGLYQPDFQGEIDGTLEEYFYLDEEEIDNAIENGATVEEDEELLIIRVNRSALYSSKILLWKHICLITEKPVISG